jgi:hypothetical protein
MLPRRLLAAVAVLAVSTLPLFGQDKDKDKSKDKKDDKAPPAKAEEKPGDKADKKDEKPAAPAAGDKATLRWKFEKDKPFYQKMTTKTDQTMKVMNSDVKQTQNQTFYFSWTPEKQEGDAWVIKQKIEGVAMDIDIGGSKIGFDSTAAKDSGNNQLADFFKAMVGAEFRLTLNTKDMKVTKVEGRDEFVKKLAAANPQMAPLLNQILSETALKEMAEPTFAATTGKEEAKGAKWTRESTLDMGPIGKYSNTYTYTYEGKDGALDKIKVDTALKYTPPGEQQGAGGVPFKIKGADLKGSNGSGTVLFDEAKGRLDKSTSKLDLNGDLSIEIGGQTTKVELKQTQESTVETSDTNYVQPKPAAPAGGTPPKP